MRSVVHADEDRAAAVGRARDLALADALVTIGRALTRLGTRLNDAYAVPEAAPERPPAPEPPDGATEGAAVPRGGLGPRQLAVLALGGLGTSQGLAVSDVMRALNYRRPNAHTVLGRLTELGYLEQVPDERPTRWRKPPAAGQVEERV